MQRSRFPLHADLVRTLMHIEVTPNTMACAMEEVESLLPQRTACNGIELRTSGPVREFQHLQTDMPFEHKGIDFPLAVAQRT